MFRPQLPHSFLGCRRDPSRPHILLFLLLLAMMCLSACSSHSTSARKAPPVQQVPDSFFEPTYPAMPVVIEPGDILTVRFHYHPELDVIQTVRPDGKVSLTMFQGITAAGLSPEEFQTEVVRLYSKEYVRPVVAVGIEKKTTAQVYVSGQVNAGGVKPLPSNSTVGQILAQCGVKERDADLGSVMIVRKFSDKDFKVYRVDARFENGAERDIYLAPNDIVYVPRNAITLIGDFVQKYLRDVIPPQMNVIWGINTDLTSTPLLK